MRDKITINDREIEMAANAASPFIYQKIFHEDFETIAKDVNAWRKMCFVMAKQAELGEVELYNGKLTETDCLIWLMDFDPMDFADLLNFAADLYSRQQKTKSTPKKQAG